MRPSLRLTAAALASVVLLLGACGDDDPTTAGAGTTAPDDTAGGETTSTTAGGDGGEFDELCALATEMFEQDDFPSTAQIEQYQELAPEELTDAVTTAGDPIIAADGDLTAVFVAIADDEVEAAIGEIDAFERENCGIEHDPLPPEEQVTIDPTAARVDVIATEYDFDFTTELAAGPTSFVMTNEGDEVHFMAVTQIAEGHTMQEALEFEGDPVEAGLLTGVQYESGLAAIGGDDEEVLTFDLEAGDWAMLCFISGPDGTPHAFTGMAIPFTVS